MFTLGGTAISCKSLKQTAIAKSTMEFEFMALDRCGEELNDYVVPLICIHCDSQSAISRAKNSMYNSKPRHICRRHNTIRQLLSTEVISLEYVKSKNNIADLLTKGLNRELFKKTSRGMRLNPIK